MEDWHKIGKWFIINKLYSSKVDGWYKYLDFIVFTKIWYDRLFL